jgi:hypothetical protein
MGILIWRIQIIHLIPLGVKIREITDIVRKKNMEIKKRPINWRFRIELSLVLCISVTKALYAEAGTSCVTALIQGFFRKKFCIHL